MNPAMTDLSKNITLAQKTTLQSAYTLVKLAKPAPSHGRIVSAVHLANVVPFEVAHTIHGQVTGKWNLFYR